ncbi:WD repeat-containing protein 20, partial [Contarinia nasturtii]|uniref:WD repeat-containing protein 20 n=1 Tax=Contarinia nasturtii TaxID=265458 RepID=UPI0012D3BFF8
MDQNGKDDLKTQFITREGTYRLITLSEYSRPNRVGYQSNQNNPQVRVSLLPAKVNSDVSATNNTGSSVLTSSTNTTNAGASNNSSYILQQPSANTNNSGITNGISEIPPQHQQFQQGFSDKICFNFGKELYVYTYRGVKKNVDLCKPIDKKLYKGTSPSCHDFNGATSVNDCASLLVGFTTGQIQLVQPGKRETGRLYNEERLIDKTKVTCLKWLPKSPNLFLASHSSGYLYLYNEELPCCPNVPNYQNFKTGDGFTILTCKSKASRNPLYKWVFNSDNCSINEFCFSPCGTMLAIVSQDGFLRVFYYDTMELLGIARSYFGGFLCVCWSPDSKYVVVGGEDDLVTVWSVNERRVVARGQGHRSWVSVVAFDPYTSYSHSDSSELSDDDNTANCSSNGKVQKNNDNITDDIPCISRNMIRRTSYRLGSVGQDTQLCLWDITEDILRRQSYEKRHRRSSLETQNVDYHDDIQIAKVSSSESDNNSKINSFRSKFTIVTSTEGSGSNNITEVLDNSIVPTKPTNSFSKLCSNSTKATNVMEKSINAVSGTIPVRSDSTSIASNETSLNKGNNFKISESGINTF